MTPGEFQREIRVRLGDTVADALAPLTRIVEQASYGPQAAGDAEISQFRSARRTVLSALRKVPRYRPVKVDGKEMKDAPVAP
jgi:hypothetical protein